MEENSCPYAHLLFAVFPSAFAFVLTSALAAKTAVRQPLAEKPVPGAPVKLKSDFYVPATPDNPLGLSAAQCSQSGVTVPSGATVTLDTFSHEGILEDQGRDPAKYWRLRRAATQVLNDAKAIAGSSVVHYFVKDLPHVVIGAVAWKNAHPETLKR